MPAKLTKEDFIKKSIAKHGDKYDYSQAIVNGNRTKVKIICKKHGVFEQTPSHHMAGQGCRKCATEASAKKARKPKENFLELAIAKHGDRYDYSSVVYFDRSTNVDITCKEHGVFKQSPTNHIKGQGCPKCALVAASKKYTKSIEDFITQANQLHENKYDYSLVIYNGSDIDIDIICKKHGIFKQTPHNHLRKKGCPTCGFISNAQKHKKTIEYFIKQAIEIHGDKYDYSSSVYHRYNTDINIKCNKHGIFTTTPLAHLNKKGCPKCDLCPSCQLWLTYGDICGYCNPETRIKQYIKTKEYAVVEFLRTNLPNTNFIHNKSIGSECTGGHLFPDILFDCGYYYIIVEVDEHKHRGADYACDKKRMYEIIAKLGLPCIFIRYNPDNKNSSKYDLLEVIQFCLSKDEELKLWDDFGFYAEYLFYE